MDKWTQNQLFVKNCQHVRAALGLHLQLAHAYANELHLFEKYLPEAKYIGEVGLDGAPEYANTLEIQRQVFRTILDLCASTRAKMLLSGCTQIILVMGAIAQRRR